ncbi:MAG: hypothetical protein H6833_10520 [Planctomycetes bacterium]|nr:hypothetical protein [Planctomycetota bacterium]
MHFLTLTQNCVVASVVLAVTALAQSKTVYVDATGRASALTTVDQGIAAANDGDRIHVLDGQYSGFTCSKGVTIVAGPSAHILPSGAQQPLIRVTGIPAGKTCFVTGFSIVADQCTLRIDGNDGIVHLQDCKSLSPALIEIRIQNSRGVVLRNHEYVEADCESLGSTVDIEACNLLRFSTPRPALTLKNSTVVLHESRLYSNTFAVEMDASTLLGNAQIYAAHTGYAVRGTGSLHADSKFKPCITSGCGAGLVDPRISVVIRQPAQLRVIGTWLRLPGEIVTVQTELAATKPPFVLFAGLATQPIFVAPASGLWWLQNPIALTTGSGSTPVMIPTPANQSLRGLRFAIQTLSVDPSGLLLSNVVQTAFR